MFDMSKAHHIIKQLKEIVDGLYAELDALAPVDTVFTESNDVSCILHAVDSPCLADVGETIELSAKVFSFTDATAPCLFCLPEYFTFYQQLSHALSFIRVLGVDVSLKNTDLRRLTTRVRLSLRDTLSALRYGAGDVPVSKSIILEAATQMLPLLEELTVLCAEGQVEAASNTSPGRLFLVDVQKLMFKNHFSTLEELALLFSHQVFSYRSFYVTSKVPTVMSEYFQAYSTPVSTIPSRVELDCILAFLEDGLTLEDAALTASSI